MGGNRRFPTARRAKRQRADHPAAADGFQRKPLSAKRKSTLPGAFSFGKGGQFRSAGSEPPIQIKRKSLERNLAPSFYSKNSHNFGVSNPFFDVRRFTLLQICKIPYQHFLAE